MAAAFRRNLDAQSTTHDQTISMSAITDGPAVQVPVPGSRPAPLESQPQSRPLAGGPPQPAAAPRPAAPQRAGRTGGSETLVLTGAVVTTSTPSPPPGFPRPKGPSGPSGPPETPPPAQDGDQPPAKSRKRHSAGNRPARLPATVGISAVLAVIGGLALILTNGALSPDPTAPSALPDDATSQNMIIGGSAQAGAALSASGSPTPLASRTVVNRTPDPGQSTAPNGAPSTAGSSPTAAPTTTQAIPTTAAPTPSSTWTELAQGSSGTEVTQLQSMLKHQGYMIQSNSRGYGSNCKSSGWDSSGQDEDQTTDAIYQFQRNYDDFAGGDLQATGVCDHDTWEALVNNPVYIQDCYGGA